MSEGENAFKLASQLYPIYRSITGTGARETLRIVSDYIDADDKFRIYEVKSGTKAFDWTVPKEWIIRDAFIEAEDGKKYACFSENNLHIVGYSSAVDKWINYEELLDHIYTQPDQENAIPYVTSYYNERYGFCMSEAEKKELKPGRYRAYIDSDLFDGSLSYGEIVFPGEENSEVFFSTYTCHPSMADDNCSGLALAAELARYVKSLSRRRYTYRFAFVPETIGAIVYLSQCNRLKELKKNVIAGYTLSCVGNNGDYSIINTKSADSLSDRTLMNILRFSENTSGRFKTYSYLERGSDERQYNSPGVELSLAGFSRTKYWEFPEYHTSLDTLDHISIEGLQGSFDILKEVIDALECNYFYKMVLPCEPQLGKRGMYPKVSQKGVYDEIQALMNFVGYADGKQDLIEMSDMIGQPVRVLIPIIKKLRDEKMVLALSKKED